jgi:hypothetical protein
MKRIKIGKKLLQIGLLIYVIENFYFGWNELPMSDLELYADNTVKAFIYIGFVIYVMPLWEIYESAIKKNESNNNTN